MMQFGFSLSSWGILVSTFSAFLEWSDTDEKRWNVGITTITNLGTMIGALCAGAFIEYGKVRMMLYLNGVLVVSIGICMVENIYIIAFGRFVWGICAGCLTVFAPNYLNDFVPKELTGSFGSLSALGLTSGIAIPTILSIALEVDPVAAYKENPNDFFVT